MNMIHKKYACSIPYSGDRDFPYTVSAWMAEGSNTVNLTTYDRLFGWNKSVGVQVEKLSDYVSAGVKTMDDLVKHLFYVIEK